MVWFSTMTTLVGLALVLHGRKYDLATQGRRLEENEGPTVLVGLGILCLFVGGGVGIISSIAMIS